MIIEVMKGAMDMQIIEMESMTKNAIGSYMEFVTKLEILTPKIEMGRKVGSINIHSSK